LDKLQRLYIWFVLLLSALSFPTRVFLARRTAELTAKRMQSPRAQRLYVISGWLFIACAVLFYTLPIFRTFGRNVVLLYLVFSIVSGTEFLANTFFPQPQRLILQNRVFGFLHLGVALLALFMLQQL
jgi:hypothetical protein